MADGESPSPDPHNFFFRRGWNDCKSGEMVRAEFRLNGKLLDQFEGAFRRRAEQRTTITLDKTLEEVRDFFNEKHY